MTYAGPARSEAEANAALRLAATVFYPADEASAALERKSFLLSAERGIRQGDVIVVVLPDERVIGTIVLVDRIMPRAGIDLPVTYLSSVCVAEDMRGKGHSVALMEAALTACDQRDCAMALLIARRAVDHYYTRFGFWGLSSHNQMDIKPRAKGPAAGALRPAEEKDLAACAALYEHAYAKAFGHHKRSAAYWPFLLRKAPRLGTELLVLDEDGKLAGYFLAAKERIFEFAVADRVPAVDALASFARRYDHERLLIDIGPTHAAAPQLLDCANLTSRECRYGGHMGRVIDAERLAAAAKLRIAERAAANRLQPMTERLDGLEYGWDGRNASVAVTASALGFGGATRLFGASQLSLSPVSALDPGEPFNILLADQV
jgi:GNAT superfamily N-acetyltransferase